MKIGDLVKIKNCYQKQDDTFALIIEKYDIGSYWKVQPLGSEFQQLVDPENIEVISGN